MDELTPAQNAADFLAANPGQMYVSIGPRQFERNTVTQYCTGCRRVEECATATTLPVVDCREVAA